VILDQDLVIEKLEKEFKVIKEAVNDNERSYRDSI